MPANSSSIFITHTEVTDPTATARRWPTSGRGCSPLLRAQDAAACACAGQPIPKDVTSPAGRQDHRSIRWRGAIIRCLVCVGLGRRVWRYKDSLRRGGIEKTSPRMDGKSYEHTTKSVKDRARKRTGRDFHAFRLHLEPPITVDGEERGDDPRARHPRPDTTRPERHARDYYTCRNQSGRKASWGLLKSLEQAWGFRAAR